MPRKWCKVEKMEKVLNKKGSFKFSILYFFVLLVPPLNADNLLCTFL